ncbi:MAG: GNAT family N-acyltransferase [Hyphomicrobiales bacterium]|nr:GNAT family N-acyltransferase [Hyphomicrobiales bacterium]
MVLSPRRLVSRFKSPRRARASARGLFALVPRPIGKKPKRPGKLPIVPYGRPQKIYGAIGGLEVRLARTRGDLRRAQKLRYQVFYEEMAATPGLRAKLSRRDEDKYDQICDHLLVVDKGTPAARKKNWLKRARVVGTYRVLRQEVAEKHGGFYTQGEYDIAPLVAAKRATHRFVELGRSCVLKPYRNRRTVELLWHGLWTYVREHGGHVMIGCASFPGVDPEKHALALSFLYHRARAPEEWRVKAHPKLFVDMNMMKPEEIDAKAALKAMPPLIKGYLRLGAYVGDGAVVDRQFGTTDVLVILPIEAIDPRYFSHFGAPGETRSELDGGSD